jgi:hypothetical protein
MDDGWLEARDKDAWCPRHAELFRSNGASPEEIFHQVVNSLADVWRRRSPNNARPTNESVIKTIKKVSKGKPFCCWIGDEKLQTFLVSVATKIEKAKAGGGFDAESDDRGPDETSSKGS